MSDVSKTTELIAYARKWIKLHRENEYQREAAKIMTSVVAALEAATRVPVQGEPNGEPCLGCGSAAEDGHDDCTIKVRTFRVTAPDAATEGRMTLAELEDMAETHAFCADRLFIETELVDELRAERDAALAAIERVRAINTGSNRALYGNNFETGMAKALWLVKTALDGAPEPEVAELPETGLEMRDSDGDLIMSGEHRKVLHQGMYVCDSCVNDLGLNVRWDRADRMEGHPLPVEGDSKP